MDWDLEALRAMIGWRTERRADRVELRHARDYAHAIGHPRVPEQVGDPVPPVLVACFLQEPPRVPHVERFGSHWLNGADGFTIHGLLRVGDELTSATTLTGVELKHGRSGPLGLLTLVTEFTGPDERPVIVHTGTRLRR